MGASVFPVVQRRAPPHGFGLDATVHYGQAEAVRQARGQVLSAAYRRHPERFVRGVPEVPAPPGQTQIAAVAPAETIDLDARILFAEGSAELSAGDKQKLLAVADQLQRDPEIRIQLLAFAAGDDATPNAARRLSLSRALAVRGFLVDQGIAAARVQVRALGQSSEDGPQDRVDIKPQGG